MATDSSPSKWGGKASVELPNVKAEEIWPLVADFCGVHKWFPTLETCVLVEGIAGEPGCVRYCAGFRTHIEHSDKTRVNWTKQKLLSIDSGKMSLSCATIDGNVGFHSYVSTFTVLGRGDTGCAIEWEYEVDPVEGWRLEDFDSFIKKGLQVMANRMEEALKA